MLELSLNLGGICMGKRKNRQLGDAKLDDTNIGKMAQHPIPNMTVDLQHQPTTLAVSLPEFPTNDLPFPDWAVSGTTKPHY